MCIKTPLSFRLKPQIRITEESFFISLSMFANDFLSKCVLQVGLHLEYNDARNRIACHLQRNLDRSKSEYEYIIFLRRRFTVTILYYKALIHIRKYTSIMLMINNLMLGVFRFNTTLTKDIQI